MQSDALRKAALPGACLAIGLFVGAWSGYNVGAHEGPSDGLPGAGRKAGPSEVRAVAAEVESRLDVLPDKADTGLVHAVGDAQDSGFEERLAGLAPQVQPLIRYVCLGTGDFESEGDPLLPDPRGLPSEVADLFRARAAARNSTRGDPYSQTFRDAATSQQHSDSAASGAVVQGVRPLTQSDIDQADVPPSVKRLLEAVLKKQQDRDALQNQQGR